jgi:hypothetical protein
MPTRPLLACLLPSITAANGACSIPPIDLSCHAGTHAPQPVDLADQVEPENGVPTPRRHTPEVPRSVSKGSGTELRRSVIGSIST